MRQTCRFANEGFDHTLRIDLPYERMNISGLTGLTAAQRAALWALGALESSEPAQQRVVYCSAASRSAAPPIAFAAPL